MCIMVAKRKPENNKLQVILAFAKQGQLKSIHDYCNMLYCVTISVVIEYVVNWLNII